MSSFASHPGREHFALKMVIRGTYLVTALLTGLILFTVVMVPVTLLFKAITDASSPFGYRVTMAIFSLVGIFLFGVVVKRSFVNLCKNISGKKADVVANFSIVFALFLAIDWYQLLPANLPPEIVRHLANNHFFAPFAEPDNHRGLHYRWLLSILAFFVFNKLILAYLRQILDSGVSRHSRSSPPNEPDIPQFPQKSPLRPL